MADVRSVAVKLRAEVSGYLASMAAARKATNDLIDTVGASDRKQQSLAQLGNVAGGVGLAAAAGMGIAVKAAADFDKAMSSVEAATRGSAQTMDALRSAALKAGADTAFSATEAAAGIENLAKAGVSTRDILKGGLSGALDLAAAGQIEVADAAESAATAMTQFGLKGKDVPHIADLLAAAAGKAQGEVGDFSAALNQSGLVANQTGLSIEETTAALASFASQGLIGSDAGTSLKTMLQSLTPSSEKAAAAMENLGIEAYDGQGQFIGLAEYAGRLRQGLSDMSDEQRNATLKTIFGSDAVRAATVLYDQGAAGIHRWTANVNDQGFAAETAATKMNNLSGDLEELKGSLETAFIGTGQGATSGLRGLTQNLTGVVNLFNKLPDPLKASTFNLAALAAVLGGGIFVGTRVINGIADIRTSITELGVSSGKTRTAMRGLAGAGIGLAAMTVGVGAINSINDAIDETLPGVNAMTERLLGLGRAGGRDDLGAPFDDLGASIDRIANRGALTSVSDGLQAVFETVGFKEARSLREARAELELTDQALAQIASTRGAPAAERAFRELVESEELTKAQAKALRAEMPLLAEALAGIRLEANKTKGKTDDLAFLLGGGLPGAFGRSSRGARGTAGAMDTAGRAAKDLKGRMQELSDVLEGRASWRSYQAAIDDVRKSLKENGRTLDQGTAKGRANAETLDTIATSALGVAESIKDTNRQNAFLDRARKVYIDAAVDMGKTEGAARRLANRIFGIPEKRVTKPEFDDRQADRDRRRYEQGINGLPKDPTTKPKFDDGQARGDVNAFVGFFNGALGNIKDEPVRINVQAEAKQILQMAQGLNIFGGNKAFGGEIPGTLGTPGKDSVLINAMPDEHVVTTREVKAAGHGDTRRGHRIWQAIRNAALLGALPDPMDLPAFADGGSIRPSLAHAGVDAATDMAARLAAGFAAEVGNTLSERLNKALQFGGNGQPLGPGGTLAPGQLVRGQMAVRGEVGSPYVWGGVGPGGYDCSGLQSFAYNSAVGMPNPHTRRGSTGTMPWGGMGPGPGGYTIGWFTGSPGHMSGNMGGLNIESSGGVGVSVGSRARSPMDPMFNGLAHYDSGGPLRPGLTLAYNGTGADEYVVKPVQGFQDGGFVGGARPITSGYVSGQLAIPEQLPSLRAYNRATRELNQAIREQARERRQLTRENRQAKDAAKDLRVVERELDKLDDKKSIRADARENVRDIERSRKVLDSEKATNRERREARNELERLLERREKLSRSEREVVRLLERRNRLRDRDRTQSKQAEQAERDLAKAKDQHSKAQQRVSDAVSDYAQKQRDAIAAARQTSEQIQATGAVFGEGFLDAGSVSARLGRAIRNATRFRNQLRTLSARGLSPYLLSQLVAEGPTQGAITFASELLRDPIALDALNAQSARLVQVGNQIGSMAAQPAFLQPLSGREIARESRDARVYAPVHVNAPQSMSPDQVGNAVANRLVGSLR